jgi:hypothetical protein
VDEIIHKFKKMEVMMNGVCENLPCPPVVTVTTPLCAWCLSEQGIAASEGSHGICCAHAEQMLLQLLKLRSRRVQQMVGVK